MSEEQRDEKDKTCPEGMIRKDGECVMPDVTFEAFVLSLNTAALFHMGELADPVTGKKQKDPMMARQTIDTLNLLQEKTHGNLSEEEADLLDTILHDLRLRFVLAKK
ncbi:MAG: hypothetical protein COX17_06140 [Deltaproteobacteria bacterium CG23_combo_of_CG06-09_8_20_14_all_60_8]|nr:MAG: hypothetical protein AUK28_10335 [Desulfobacterales bacterium CG2_30_60_27]PIP43590.1 MAG: hypothetical protein COX17_06140 [Deltaproteobacteria bacterium CG23_combo_of_CG06-09_8_20_14_all_60_8]